MGRHIKELMQFATNVGEVVTHIDDHRAHRSLRYEARQIGVPLRSITRVMFNEIFPAPDTDTEASRLVPSLARWMVKHELDVVLSPEQLSSLPRHRIAGRAIMRAAMKAADVGQRQISIIIGYGPEAAQGLWPVESPFEDHTSVTDAVTVFTPETPDQTLAIATSYSRIRVNPGIASGGSVEHHFGRSSGE
jgi:hypothetical protein